MADQYHSELDNNTSLDDKSDNSAQFQNLRRSKEV